MVLETRAFRVHRSLRKTIQKLRVEGRLDIRFDHDFERVIRACAHTPREGQDGTWILPAMVQAYTRLHHAGVAHSVEAWIDGELAGGLYCINLGGMVYGESMFSRQSDASKIALAALVGFCRAKDLPLIDCQQNTPHLASLGGQLMQRVAFCRHVQEAMSRPAPRWEFQPIYWQNVIPEHRPPA
jgi:leucyl/phenylalanyl-tRNA--protein transferase